MENKKIQEFTGEELANALAESYEAVQMYSQNIIAIKQELAKRKEPKKVKGEVV